MSLREVIGLHFDPQFGSRFWLERAEHLPFDPRTRIRSLDDLAVLGALHREQILERPVLDFVQAYEHGDWEDCRRLGRELVLEDAKATSLYRDSVAWAMESFTGAP